MADKKASAERHWDRSLRDQAYHMMVPSFLMCFGFLWWSTFGFVQLFCGLLHGGILRSHSAVHMIPTCTPHAPRA